MDMLNIRQLRLTNTRPETLLLSEIIFPHAINITDQIHQNCIHMLIYVDISNDFFLYVSILLTGFCAVI